MGKTLSDPPWSAAGRPPEKFSGSVHDPINPPETPNFENGLSQLIPNEKITFQLRVWLVLRKTVFKTYDQVKHRPGSAVKYHNDT